MDWHAPILAIDSSYAVFHRFFAVRRWERMSGQRSHEPDATDCSENDLVAFGDSFRQMLFTQMRAARASPSNTLLLLDCPRADIWRRDLLPSYKASRATPTDFPSNIFAHFRDSLVPELVRDVGVKALGFPRAEADDVAGVFVTYCIDKGAHDVTLLTGDCDFAQLCVPDGVRVVDMKGECLLSRATKKACCENDAAAYLAVKILQGDRGDNIPPARERIGPRNARKLMDDPAKLERFLADPDNRRRYDLNRTLIDLACTPPSIAGGLVEGMNMWAPPNAF